MACARELSFDSARSPPGMGSGAWRLLGDMVWMFPALRLWQRSRHPLEGRDPYVEWVHGARRRLLPE